mmetsp:Transcript_42484/g.91690  ORF Transcript_42484/g.91690 Transcript_42484/m.91690 type:complete len:138 (+) Transcript_42484:1783-2196(+)
MPTTKTRVWGATESAKRWFASHVGGNLPSCASSKNGSAQAPLKAAKEGPSVALQGARCRLSFQKKHKTNEAACIGYAWDNGSNLKVASSKRRPTQTQRREHFSESLWLGPEVGFFAKRKYCRKLAMATQGKEKLRKS